MQKLFLVLPLAAMPLTISPQSFAASQETALKCDRGWELFNHTHRLCIKNLGTNPVRGTLLLLSGCTGFSGQGNFDSDAFGNGRYSIDYRGKNPTSKRLVRAGLSSFYRSYTKRFGDAGYRMIKYHFVVPGISDCNAIVMERMRTTAALALAVDKNIGVNILYRSKLKRKLGDKLAKVISYLRLQTDTRAIKKLHLVGWSLGASVSATYLSNHLLALETDGWLQSATLIYPDCVGLLNPEQVTQAGVPILWMHGVSDIVAPLFHCYGLMKAAKDNPNLIRLIAFPGAHHGFDNKVLRRRAVEFDIISRLNLKTVKTPIVFRYHQYSQERSWKEFCQWLNIQEQNCN